MSFMAPTNDGHKNWMRAKTGLHEVVEGKIMLAGKE
jgi:hypothetical protein